MYSNQGLKRRLNVAPSKAPGCEMMFDGWEVIVKRLRLQTMFHRRKKDGTRHRLVSFVDVDEMQPPPAAVLPCLPSPQCMVLLALVEHLAAHKAHKSKLFQSEGRPSERKVLLEQFYAGVHTASLKSFSSRSMSFVLRHVLVTQYAPLLPYVAYDKLVAAMHASNLTVLEVTAMPISHAKLLHGLLFLMRKVSVQLTVAEDGLVTHLGVHLCRPSEHPLARSLLRRATVRGPPQQLLSTTPI
ncbi:hypothetical protein AaE_007581 [Aphanomyces astaci]|uniref:Rho-GAP domain-containing protein n=1 Tax=Aphanomyces astaci TaxID=112090 RepID=A0A6A5A262_APHAT|nr:hypothetical protein AaE_007581 [Aphanomyces astaci]